MRFSKLLLPLLLAFVSLPAAVLTTTVFSFAAGACHVEIDYNDVNLAITRLRVVNASARTCTAMVGNTVTLITRTLTAKPGETVTLNLPNGISFTTDADGIRLGPIRLGAKWE